METSLFLLHQLRRRLDYLDKKIAILRPSVTSNNIAAAFGASGAINALVDERNWLRGLIAPPLPVQS